MGGVLALVGARSGSKGVPDKNVRDLGGHPLIAWSIMCARGSAGFDRVVQFREMLQRQGLELPKGSCLGLDEPALGRMVEMTLRMERPLTNALGNDLRSHLTAERILELNARM